MIKNRFRYTTLAALLASVTLAAAAYLLIRDEVLLSSPQKTASRISGLPSSGGRVVEFEEHESKTHPDI